MHTCMLFICCDVIYLYLQFILRVDDCIFHMFSLCLGFKLYSFYFFHILYDGCVD